ncbi:MAG: efflux RND transporter periplasmic adaptor subunit [Comamonadaceae bacterium]|nr:efflux RND transporter periplasmic adaptor subunit [Comamonadaceae bacterium]
MAALDQVWVVADVPEARRGARCASAAARALSFAALPGQVLEGKVDYIYPEIAGATRTLQARIAAGQRQGRAAARHAGARSASAAGAQDEAADGAERGGDRDRHAAAW